MINLSTNQPTINHLTTNHLTTNHLQSLNQTSTNQPVSKQVTGHRSSKETEDDTFELLITSSLQNEMIKSPKVTNHPSLPSLPSNHLKLEGDG